MKTLKKKRLKKERKKTIQFVRNITGILIIIIGLAGILAGDMLSGISFILLGISINPYFWTILENFGLKINRIGKMLINLFLVVLLVITFPTTTSSDHSSDPNNYSSLISTDDKKDIIGDNTDQENEAVQQNGSQDNKSEQNNNENSDHLFEGYTLLEIDACDFDGDRMANVVVDIGYGDRDYWAFTNDYGQLVKVIADEIIIQDDYNEAVTNNGRYCSDEAKVPGVESDSLDEGHIIADSLGGVSNAYNITPQNSTLNRHGDQAYMEKVIRDAGGATNFEAIITYPNNATMIPSHYKYTYTIKGNTIVDEFDNINPEETVPDDNSSSSENKTPSNNSSGSTNNGATSSDSSNATLPITEKVWISETGSKYHSKPNCGTMNPDKATELTIEEAEARGYEPCKKCY